MKTNKLYSSLLLFIVMSLPLVAQDKLTNIDFGFPQNTEQAFEHTGYYDTDIQQFKTIKTQEFHFNSLGLISIIKYPITPTNVNQESYTYDTNQNLIQVDYLLETPAGASESKSAISIAIEDNRTTLIRTNPNGDVLKTLEFRNEAGELRGRTYFDKEGNKVKYIEYGGNEGFNVKEYNNEILVSNIIYLKNEQGKIEKTIELTEPNLNTSKKKTTTFEYNTKGDLTKSIEYYATQFDEKPNAKSTKITEYLYDDDIWVASASYEKWKHASEKTINATLRNVKTSEKVYSTNDEQQVLDFFEQAYQNYLNAKIE